MKQALIEALKQLGRGRVDAAEVIADLLMPEANGDYLAHSHLIPHSMLDPGHSHSICRDASLVLPVVEPKKKAM